MDFDNDSFEKHIEDTFIAGDGLCNPGIVEIVVKEGVERIKEIIRWGAQFDKEHSMAIMHWAKKVAIANSEYCIIKMLQVKKWKVLC